MKSICKVTLLGAVGKDPEVRYTQQEMCICSFSLATSEKRKDKEEVTQWHNCVAFGKLGEVIAQYIKKGAKLYLEGTIQYQEYEKDGDRRFATKIIANDISMIGTPQKSQKEVANVHIPADTSPEVLDDEIPF